MSVTHTARAVFSSIHKFVFAVLLVTLTQFSYAESDYAASWGPSVGSTVPIDVSQRSRRSDTKSGHVNGLQRLSLFSIAVSIGDHSACVSS